MRLLIMRHGKSDWDSGAATDHDRPLASRGVKAARRMGEVLARMGEAPELVYTSSALRATTTAELANEAGAWGAKIEIRPELYGSSPEDALEVVRTAPGAVERLMVVGHEPTWSMLAHQLTGGRVAVKTATVIGVDMPAISWSTLPGQGGTLAFVLQPRMFGSWVTPG